MIYYKEKLKVIIGFLLLAALGGLVATLLIQSWSGGYANITYSDGQHSATITLGRNDVIGGEEREIGSEITAEDIPTVEEVDAGKRHTNISESDEESDACPIDEECGKGKYIYAPVNDASAFKNYVFGKCLNSDDAYGSQCWDLADVFWQNAAGRRANTCGTGSAKGMIADGCWQKNAGDEFEMIWNPKDLNYGDWIITNNGQYGHVAMVVGSYNDGYITVLGQNQGGHSCDGGGASSNIINLNLKNFAGAFRYKPYEEQRKAQEEKKTQMEEIKPNNGVYVVKAGDTLGEIAVKLGWWKSGSLFGDSIGLGNRGLIYAGQTLNAV